MSDKKTGRPSIYTPELVEKLCAEIAKGKSVRSISKMPGMPSVQTVNRWKSEYPEFSEQYACAKQSCADSIAGQILDIAQGVLTGEYNATDARVAADIMKWTAGKLAPRDYGDKVTQDNISSDGSMTPARIERVIVDPKDKNA